MSRYLVPPRAPEQISKTKTRVHDLERRLSRPVPTPTGYVAKFSLHGGLFVVESGIELHPSGATLQLVYAIVKVAADTGTTTLSLRKNGTEFEQLRLPAGVRYNEAVVSVPFAARTDEFTLAITAVGDGIATLTAYGLFDR